MKIWQTVLSFLPFLGHFRPSLAHKNVKKKKHDQNDLYSEGQNQQKFERLRCLMAHGAFVALKM